MQEFDYSQADFERVRTLIFKTAGIALGSHKNVMVYSRLVRRVRAVKARSFAEYLDRVENGPDAEEVQAFTNALTTNMTSFFREEHHFQVLAEHVRTSCHRRPIVIWSAACSTGEEPYSIAMTLAEVFDSFEPPTRIIASDLDTEVLHTAESGVYPVEDVEKLPIAARRRFFLRGAGKNEGYARIRPELQKMMVFRQLNLLEDGWPLRPPLDAIFCRNVMIYFDKPTRRGILQKLSPLLGGKGLLFLGHSETLSDAADLFLPCGRNIYRVATGRRERPQ